MPPATASGQMRRLGPLVLLAAGACGGQTTGSPCPAGACVHEETSLSFEVNPPHGIDLLVVMDDSASMALHQEELAARLAPELEKVPGGVPELRMRVISSSLPAPGLAGFPGCAPVEPRTCVPPGSFLQATQVCGQHSSYSGTFTEAFRCAASVGTAGCGWEQPLAAARAALEGDPQDGSRFLRRDATLFLLIVTDEDDCSAPAGSSVYGAPPTAADDPVLAARCRAAGRAGGLVPVGDYVRFLQGLKPRPDQVLASVLAGWPPDGLLEAGDGPVQPLCSRNQGPVLPAVRLRAFVEAFEPQGEFHGLCPPDDAVEAALKRIGERLAYTLGQPCLPEGLIDGDPARAGVQPLCTLTETTVGPDQQPIAERSLPACDGSAPLPCWRALDTITCPSGFAARIERGCLVGAPTRLTFRCATAPR
jgi:hypothetical protein